MSESSVEPTLSPSQLHFEHYEILTGGDGTPIELGRGAMGVTYKAVDANLWRADHFEPGHSGEVGKDLVLNTVSKIGVSPTVTQCVKREYGNTSFRHSDCR